MLHDPSHSEPPAPPRDIVLGDNDKTILRQLATELAGVAALPVHREKAALWQRLNDLQAARPMVWINEIPWHEMNVGDELTLRAEQPWARDQERDLRRLLYQWRHLPGDMIVSDFLACPLALHSTSFGIVEETDVVRTDASSDIVSRHFHRQIQDWPDLEKIKMPVVTHNAAGTAANWRLCQEVYGSILAVRQVGQPHIWFTPWDYLIRWWGIEEAMLDMYERPDFVHAAVERMVDAWMTELDQFVALNVLALDCNNTRVGSGGYGYTAALPGPDYDANAVKPHNMWGCSNAQIFSEISPDFQWRFAIEHDLRWLKRWGLTYYGCCEPLERKMDLMRRIPNLRKISMNYQVNIDRAVQEVGGRYVFSYKPSPAVFATDQWHPEAARQELRQVLAKARGVNVEIIMKDISTVRYQPQRLWDWARLAVAEAEAAAAR